MQFEQFFMLGWNAMESMCCCYSCSIMSLSCHQNKKQSHTPHYPSAQHQVPSRFQCQPPTDVHPRVQERMVEVSGSLPPVLVTQMRVQVLDFGLTQLQLLWAFGEWTCDCEISDNTLSLKEREKKHTDV